MQDNAGKRMPSTALVIEDDQALANMIVGELKSAGTRVANHVDNGDAAWEASKQDYYDFILLDWKIPNLSSLALFNRFKQDQYYKKTPILVMSGYLKKKDFSLLGEYHNTASIEKPFGVKFLTQKIQLLNKESQWFNRQETKINDMIADLQVKNNLDIKVIQSMINEAPNPLPVAIIFGRTLRQLKFFTESEEILKAALQYNDHAVVLAELGKLYIETGSGEEAIKMLTRASEKSPENLERICNLGDLHLKNMDTDKAQELFNQAEAIDSQSPEAQSGKILAKNIEKWMSGAISVPGTFAGILNAIGINMVRSGNFPKGIEHYQSALTHIADNVSKAKIYFNLGLGYLRWNKPEEAATNLEKSIELSPENPKAERYLQKISGKTGHIPMDGMVAEEQEYTDDPGSMDHLGLDLDAPPPSEAEGLSADDEMDDMPDLDLTDSDEDESTTGPDPDLPEEFSNQDIELI